MTTQKHDRTVTCQTTECLNYNTPITLHEDRGAAVVCGGGCGNIIADEADWYEPPSDEELEAMGFIPVTRQVADQINNMTPKERSELAALIVGGETDGDTD